MFRANKIKISKQLFYHILDFVTVAAVVLGVIALISLVYYQVRSLKLADIKVPVATDKASYYPDQQISGIFFGETYYKGEVRILREVFCKNYHGIITPPKEAAVGDFFSTQAQPRKLNGTTLMIGTLPKNVPIGSNCVIQFTNVYEVKTPFGDRHEEVQYYTQNFSIIGKPEQQEKDQRNQQQLQIQQKGLQQSSTTNNGAFSNVGGGGANTNTAKPKTNTETPPPENKPPEPVQPPLECTVNILFIKVGCNR